MALVQLTSQLQHESRLMKSTSHYFVSMACNALAEEALSRSKQRDAEKLMREVSTMHPSFHFDVRRFGLALVLASASALVVVRASASALAVAFRCAGFTRPDEGQCLLALDFSSH
jgi:hypothetical protein